MRTPGRARTTAAWLEPPEGRLGTALLGGAGTASEGSPPRRASRPAHALAPQLSGCIKSGWKEMGAGTHRMTAGIEEESEFTQAHFYILMFKGTSGMALEADGSL